MATNETLTDNNDSKEWTRLLMMLSSVILDNA